MSNNHKFKKSLGQNFIRDIGFLESIVSQLGLSKGDTIIEVGAGEGALTRVLSRHAGRVISYEVDRSLEQTLCRGDYQSPVEFRFEDALHARIDVGKYKVVANVPYYITTPLLFKFINDPECEEVSVLVQKEVADRLAAKVGTKDYGALTIAVQAWGDVRKIKDAPRHLFYPIPNVDSAFVQIKCRGGDPPPVGFDKLLKGLFSKRRKTIENGLMSVTGKNREEIREILGKVSIDVRLRPENLTVEEYLALHQAIFML